MFVTPDQGEQSRRTFRIFEIKLFCLVVAIYPQQKSSAQMGFRVNPVLVRNSFILCYISLFTETILQQFDAFKIDIQGTLTKL